MIHNDVELQATRQRISFLQDVLADLRLNASPGDFEAMSSGYRAELEKMNTEVMEYLTCHSSVPSQVEV